MKISTSKIINKMIDKQNSLLNLSNLSIPLPDGYTVIPVNTKVSKEVFAAKKDDVLIELFADGVLYDNESFEDRLNQIINEIIEKNKNNELYKNNPNYIMFLGDHNKNIIKAKIYIQDVMVSNNSFIRMANAYFVGNNREFCQLSVSSGKYSVNKTLPLSYIKNYQTDLLTKTLLQVLVGTLNRIRFK